MHNDEFWLYADPYHIAKLAWIKENDGTAVFEGGATRDMLQCAQNHPAEFWSGAHARTGEEDLCMVKFETESAQKAFIGALDHMQVKRAGWPHRQFLFLSGGQSSRLIAEIAA